MIRKFNEHIDTTTVMKVTDPEIVELTEFVEDHFNQAVVSVHMNNDTWENEDGFPYKESSVSVAYRIMMPSIQNNPNLRLGGNPYSEEEIDASTTISDIIKCKKTEMNFATEIKSLIYRLQQYGYKMNKFSYDYRHEGECYDISIRIKDRKLKL